MKTTQNDFINVLVDCMGYSENGSNPVDPPEALVEELRKRSDEENIVDVVDELKHELNESKSYIGKLENEKKVLDAEKKALENRTVHLTTDVKAKEGLIDNFKRLEEKLIKKIQNNARLVGFLEEKLRQIKGSATPQKENKNNTVEYVVNDNTTTQDINNSQNENEQG